MNRKLGNDEIFVILLALLAGLLTVYVSARSEKHETVNRAPYPSALASTATPQESPSPPTVQGTSTHCGQSTSSLKPPIHYQHDLNDPENEIRQLNSQILNYLNVTGSTDDLKSAIERASPIFTAQVRSADIRGTGHADILTLINLALPTTATEIISIFSCTDQGYVLLDSIYNNVFASDDTQPAIVSTIDLNQNSIPDIFIRQPIISGMKGVETLAIYEWNGHSLAQVFQLESGYGEFRQIKESNRDKDPGIELSIGFFYAYEQETALATIEYSFIRPIEMIYEWDGGQYAFKCQYFTDEPALRLTILHSAETLSSCGFYDEAVEHYQTLLDNVNAGAWPTDWRYSMTPPLLYPGSLDPDERLPYASDLERDYLRAFAGYRLVQLALNNRDLPGAREILERLQQEYKPGDHGYIYSAMAVTLFENYKTTQSLDLACPAAAQTFDNVYSIHEDPGIQYSDEPPAAEFYFANMRAYGSNPDNLFAVPESIDGMVKIPICWRSNP